MVCSCMPAMNGFWRSHIAPKSSWVSSMRTRLLSHATRAWNRGRSTAATDSSDSLEKQSPRGFAGMHHEDLSGRTLQSEHAETPPKLRLSKEQEVLGRNQILAVVPAVKAGRGFRTRRDDLEMGQIQMSVQIKQDSRRI